LRSSPRSFSLPKWIKEGLAAAVDALEAIGAATDSSRFWIDTARRAQDLIETKSSLTFQRAPVQDALRTTIDAFIVVGQGLCPCDATAPAAR
jgi:hypothetical protein